MKEKRFINREISWLAFNDRVLQEAADAKVPLLERLRFLGIYSNNMDEFYKVRVATIRRMQGVGKQAKQEIKFKPKALLKEIAERVKKQNIKFDEIYEKIEQELETEKIFIINEKELNKEQKSYVKHYFYNELRPKLVPIMLHYIKNFPRLKEQAIYLAVNMQQAENKEAIYSLIEIPTTTPRFVVLPKEEDKNYVILVDDIIRAFVHTIYQQFEYESIAAHCIKITRDAELDLDIDISKSLIEKIEQSVEARKRGEPVRFVFDKEIDKDYLAFLLGKLQLTETENIIAGKRYHNFKDFMGFPNFGREDLNYPKVSPLNFPKFNKAKTIFDVIDKEDILLHYPYQKFSYLIDFIREAAIDPHVTTIKMTLYRVANNSMVVNSLINAAKNGKNVIVVVEVQARFDEELNIYWAKIMQEEGITIIYGVPGLKVHSKLCLITRVVDNKRTRYANFSTGNFNEKTSTIYSDTSLFTSDERLTYEANKVFRFFQNNYKIYNYKHLLVAPHQSRTKFYELIDQEIKNATNKLPASIFAKMNSLVDYEMIEKLYYAADKGVKIKLIVRGINSLIPYLEELHSNIEIISIVDKYLEHSRIFVFHNNGEEKIYLSSTDWMQRNLDFRVEVSFPIYDEKLKEEIKWFLNNQWNDNIKARKLDGTLRNLYVKNRKEKIRSQITFYNYLKEKYKND